MTRPMKDSGIEWIGKIPQEWRISKVKRFFETTLGKMLQPNPKDDNEELLDYLCSANITWDGIDLSSIKKMWFSPNEKKHYRLETGDLLVIEGGDVAVSCLWNGELDECYIQNAIHRVRSHEGSFNKFLYYLLYTLKHSGYIDLICNKATIAHFTKEKLGETPFIVCGFAEQVAISNFLDFKCAQIDRVIASKQKTNELLKERRQSIIYEAVTKGLDRNALMKDSGIEWMGAIPMRWGIRRLKYCVSPHVDKVKPKNNHEPLMYLGLEHIEQQSGKLEWNYSPIYDFKGDTIQFNCGDILFGKLRPYLAKCYLARNEGRCSSEFLVLTPTHLFEGQYVAYVMLSKGFINYVDSSTFGAKMPRVSWDFVGNIGFPVPTKKEQKEIADYLDRKCGELDRLMLANNISIEKLTEYRQSMIYEAVTGKVGIIS